MEWEKSCWKVKDCLVSFPILRCPDFRKPVQLQIYASTCGIGAVLTRMSGDDKHVIAYISRFLSSAERNYSTLEKECLAVEWSIDKLRAYLEGYTFTVFTDHHSWTWLYKTPSTSRMSRKMDFLQLQQFDFKIIHWKEVDEIPPDMLSRVVPKIYTVNLLESESELA